MAKLRSGVRGQPPRHRIPELPNHILHESAGESLGARSSNQKVPIKSPNSRSQGSRTWFVGKEGTGAPVSALFELLSRNKKQE